MPMGKELKKQARRSDVAVDCGGPALVGCEVVVGGWGEQWGPGEGAAAGRGVAWDMGGLVCGKSRAR